MWMDILCMLCLGKEKFKYFIFTPNRTIQYIAQEWRSIYLEHDDMIYRIFVSKTRKISALVKTIIYIRHIFFLSRPPTHDTDSNFVYSFSAFLQERKKFMNVLLFHPLMNSKPSRKDSPGNILFTHVTYTSSKSQRAVFEIWACLK